jgi:NAD(P)H-dependent FMN reductase
MPIKTIFAIPGSLRAGSSNHNILLYLAGLAPSDIDFRIYNDLGAIPPFDPGLDNDTPPAAVAGLRSNIDQADAVIICTPEYAFGVPGQLKNALDWLVSSGTLVDKPVVLITASSSGDYAHPSLLRTLGALSANIVEDACLLVPFIRSKMSDGKVVDRMLKQMLIGSVKELLDLLST